MPPDPKTLYSLVTMVPATHAEAVRSAIGVSGAGMLGRYDMCSFTCSGVGRFRPLPGANPHIGSVARGIETVEEVRIETVVQGEYLAAVVRALRAAHPYETPALFVTELVDLDALLAPPSPAPAPAPAPAVIVAAAREASPAVDSPTAAQHIIVPAAARTQPPIHPPLHTAAAADPVSPSAGRLGLFTPAQRLEFRAASERFSSLMAEQRPATLTAPIARRVAVVKKSPRGGMDGMV